MSTSQLQARYSVDDDSALPEEGQHHLDALNPSEAVDSMEPNSLEVSNPLSETTKTQKLCIYCEPMFSTIENLRSLITEEGYKHNTKKGIKEAVDRGCGLCKLMDENSCELEGGNSHIRVHARLAEKRIEGRLPLSKRISMFVEKHLPPRLRRSAILTEYPFYGRKIDELYVDYSSGIPYSELSILADEDELILRITVSY